MEDFIGTIVLFAGNFAPQGWADCNGQLLPISQNAALFSILGTTYGGDGRSTFALPDLRSRVPVGIGQGPGLSNYNLGQMAGTESVTLNANQLPAHTHTATQAVSSVSGGTLTGATVTIQALGGASNHNVPQTNDCLAASDFNGEAVNTYSNGSPNVNLRGGTVTGGSITGATVSNGAITIGQTGGNQPHSNVQPYLGMRYIICLQGIYPSRP